MSMFTGKMVRQQNPVISSDKLRCDLGSPSMTFLCSDCLLADSLRSPSSMREGERYQRIHLFAEEKVPCKCCTSNPIKAYVCDSHQEEDTSVAAKTGQPCSSTDLLRRL